MSLELALSCAGVMRQDRKSQKYLLVAVWGRRALRLCTHPASFSTLIHRVLPGGRGGACALNLPPLPSSSLWRGLWRWECRGTSLKLEANNPEPSLLLVT